MFGSRRKRWGCVACPASGHGGNLGELRFVSFRGAMIDPIGSMVLVYMLTLGIY
jgi:hypothetical protein